MKCEDFADWLQTTLDERNRLKLPPDLAQHVQECECCRGQLDAWHQIASLLPTANLVTETPRVDHPVSGNHATRGNHVTLVASMLAVAAGIALIVSVARTGTDSPGSPEGSEKIAKVQSVQEATQANAAIANVDPTAWWQQLQNRDWIGQTMPTVQSVRAGVEPFGKPFKQAVSILTMGGQGQTS